jgi:hypothetical protein
MSRKSAGRPKKAGPRKPSGDLRPVNDLGTLELSVHRATALDPVSAARCLAEIDIAEMQSRCAANDHEMRQATAQMGKALESLHSAANDRRASSTLGLIYARKWITGAQHYAGGKYANLYIHAVRRVHVRGVLGNLVGGGLGAISSDDPERAAETRVDYLAARKALNRCGIATAGIVDSVCVFDQLPSLRRLDDLRMGLEVLREHFELVGRRS